MAQDHLLSKLCPPFCLHLNVSSPESSETPDSVNDPFSMIDNPFTTRELESAIYSSKSRSSSGLDRFDYNIIRSISSNLLSILLNIYNELFAQGLFPDSWNLSLIIFVPKPGEKGVRPIALLSLLLETLGENVVSQNAVGN